jgi:hypothetical protein
MHSSISLIWASCGTTQKMAQRAPRRMTGARAAAIFSESLIFSSYGYGYGYCICVFYLYYAGSPRWKPYSAREVR